jgi:hypothetical protein
MVYVDPELGRVSLRSDKAGADENLFNEWLASACEHGPSGQLVARRLGNIALIGFLRSQFENAPNHFSTLLAKVVYTGTHSGDFLSLSDIEDVASEMLEVHALHCADASDEAILREFEACMIELVEAARTVGKPIVFV